MIGRVIEIASDDRHLAVSHGFMTISSGGKEVGRVPLDDIGVLLCHAHGLTYSNNLIVALAERGASLVICGAEPYADCLGLAAGRAPRAIDVLAEFSR